MKTDYFFKQLHGLKPKPGNLSEREKILPYRQVLFDLYPGIDYRPAAVLILLYPKENDIFTVLIERNWYDGVHSGQIAFPGGKKELQDRNLKETALREAHEELGIIPDKVRVVRELTSVKIPVSRFEVTPYLGYSEKPVRFVPDPSEVNAVLEIPLSYLIREPWKIENKNFRGKEYPVFFLPFGDYKIWGATAIVIAELRDLLREVRYF